MGPGGPSGSKGPQGDRGPRGLAGTDGKDGAASFDLIRVYLDNEEEWDEEFRSYYVYDSRFSADTVLQVWVEKFYENTGDPYYVTIDHWTREQLNFEMQVGEAYVRFYDPLETLQFRTVVLVVANSAG